MSCLETIGLLILAAGIYATALAVGAFAWLAHLLTAVPVEDFIAVLVVWVHTAEEYWPWRRRSTFGEWQNSVVGGNPLFPNSPLQDWATAGALATVLPALLLAGPAWTAAAFAFMLVDALTHAGFAVWRHEYHPGALTAAVLYLPLSLAQVPLLSAHPWSWATGLVIPASWLLAVLRVRRAGSDEVRG